MQWDDFLWRLRPISKVLFSVNKVKLNKRTRALSSFDSLALFCTIDLST